MAAATPLQHNCIKQVFNQQMTHKIEKQNYPVINCYDSNEIIKINYMRAAGLKILQINSAKDAGVICLVMRMASGPGFTKLIQTIDT